MGPMVSEEKSFEIVDGRRTDERTDDGACLYYKHPPPRTLRLRWAKNLHTAFWKIYNLTDVSMSTGVSESFLTFEIKFYC